MADLQKVLEEATKLNQSIRQLLRLSTYNKCDDLSELEMDLTDPEQVLVRDELRVVMDKLADVEDLLTYLNSPIREVSRLHRNSQGKYETASGRYYCCGSRIPHKGHKLPYSAKKARKSYLNIAKSKRWTAKKLRKAIGEQLTYIKQAGKQLARFKALAPDVKLPNWLTARFEVIPKVYAQKKCMYDNHTHTVPDRIVSLAQPHVRPINRGKRPQPTEFGQKLHLSVVDGYTFLEQTSWSNFNEGCDLQAAVEDYRRKFGCYPEAILADKIYQTRANRAWCQERGIRLSGPALGRRRTGDTEASRQMHQDACGRNAIEGRNGNLKRRYGLDLIMSKLDETAKTEAALNILAMNAAYRLCRWLALLFPLPRVVWVFQ